MGRNREEPGDWFDYGYLNESLLSEDLYSIQDLVDLNLFYNRYFVLDAIDLGKLKAKKIGTAYVIQRDDLLDYWEMFRNNPPCEEASEIALTASELNLISNAVTCEKIRNPSFSVRDLISNLLNMKYQTV